MAVSKNLQTISIEAGADLSAKQFFLLELATDGQVTRVNGTTDKAMGVLQNKPSAAGRAANVAISGVTKVWASSTNTAAITPGTLLTPLATGKVRADSGAGAEFVVGQSMSSLSTGVTAIISMLITGMGPRST